MKLRHLGIFGIISLLSYTAMVVFSPLAYPGYDWLSMAVIFNAVLGMYLLRGKFENQEFTDKE